jgi:hypothetical protein
MNSQHLFQTESAITLVLSLSFYFLFSLFLPLHNPFISVIYVTLLLTAEMQEEFKYSVV